MDRNTERILALRGRDLEREVRSLVRARAEGHACHRCARPLAPGGVCPDHGPRPKRPVEMREGW